MTRFLVTGASGLLGINFSLRTCHDYEVIGQVNQHALQGVPFDVVQMDLCQPGAAQALVESTQPDVIIHAAALANLESCEKNPQVAMRLNAEVPGELARLAERRAIRMIHISTDAVFDGQKGNYTETDSPNPLSVYARSKLLGEEAVANANPHAIIARVNFYGWSLEGQRSLGEFFVSHLVAGKQVRGFTDVFFCPLETSQIIDLLVLMQTKNLSGLYHTVNHNSLSKFDFGQAIAREFDLDGSLIQPSSWRDSGLVAARSHNLTLNTDKLAGALGMELPDLSSGLKHFHQLYREDYPQHLRRLMVVTPV